MEIDVEQIRPSRHPAHDVCVPHFVEQRTWSHESAGQRGGCPLGGCAARSRLPPALTVVLTSPHPRFPASRLLPLFRPRHHRPQALTDLLDLMVSVLSPELLEPVPSSLVFG